MKNKETYAARLNDNIEKWEHIPLISNTYKIVLKLKFYLISKSHAKSPTAELVTLPLSECDNALIYVYNNSLLIYPETRTKSIRLLTNLAFFETSLLPTKNRNPAYFSLPNSSQKCSCLDSLLRLCLFKLWSITWQKHTNLPQKILGSPDFLFHLTIASRILLNSIHIISEPSLEDQKSRKTTSKHFTVIQIPTTQDSLILNTIMIAMGNQMRKKVIMIKNHVTSWIKQIESIRHLKNDDKLIYIKDKYMISNDKFDTCMSPSEIRLFLSKCYYDWGF